MLAIKPAMAEHDWKTVPGVVEGDRRDRRGSAIDGAPDSRYGHGFVAAGRLWRKGKASERGAVRWTCWAEGDGDHGR